MRSSLRTVDSRASSIARALLALVLIAVMALALVVVENASPTPASGYTSGPRNAGTGTNVDRSSSIYSWSSPGNITADDTSYATVSALPVQPTVTDYIQGTSYGFSIPTDATISGIAVKIGRYAGNTDIRDDILRLVKGGTITGDNKAATGTTWAHSGSVEEASYGDSSELWGTTWTASEINASNFGVVLSAKNYGLTAPNLYVDYMQITVTYTTVPSIGEAATLYNSAESATVSQMTPQTEYAVKVTVSDAGTIDDLNTVTVSVFYDSDGDDSPADIPAADTRTCFIMTCTVGSTPLWSQNPSSSTTWDIVETSCDQPTLTDTSGDFWFHFKPGKVATEATDWDVYVSVVDDGSSSDTWYDAGDYDMLWYGEIAVSGTGPDWGNVAGGMDFSDSSAKESTSATYICNGNYDAAVTTAATWGSGSTLNTAGTPGMNEFSLKAWSSDNLTAADLVTGTAGDCVIDDTGDLTTESGDTNSAITLYLKLGIPFAYGSYSGDITLYIRNR